MVRESLKGQRVVSRARMLLNEEIKEGTISEVHDSEITVKWDAEFVSSENESIFQFCIFQLC